MLPIDPAADRSRKAWVPCPNCDDRRGCTTCEAGRTCQDHWRYLLSSKGRVVHLQCPNCAYLWSWDSRIAPRDLPGV